ncbi:uncharacterized protein [Henckelia pumila]|uniref:uncharacterized protein n=1 Tax=Henckelia pumila TaxID=405737 RepID=UPI003C6EA235
MDDTLLPYKEGPMDEVLKDISFVNKLMPSIDWEEWRFVRDSLFSSSPDLVASALQRISMWRGRGYVPVEIEITAAIIETQQKDPFFRDNLSASALQSQVSLAMQYCMAIMRLVNGVIEKTRKKNEISIGEAADAIGIPRSLIDIRHEGSHRDLPSLQLVRRASGKAIDWLKSYYWEHQENAIPNPNIRKENIEKIINHRLQKVVLCLRAKTTAKVSYRNGKGKCFKSRLTKLLKKVICLYSSFSLQVAHGLLEFLLSALYSSDFKEHSDDSKIEHSTKVEQTACDDWKSIVLKLSKREPELLAMLADKILEKMEAQEAMNYESGEHQPLENPLKSHGLELLLCLFEWLVPHLKMLTTVRRKESSEYQDFLPETRKVLLAVLLRRCLLISTPENKQLMGSALFIAHLIGDLSLLHKLKKLSSLRPLDFVSNSNPPGDVIPLAQQEDSLRRAEEKFELIKQCRIKGKDIKTGWKVDLAHWCPIGRLPCTTGFSSRLPIPLCTHESTIVVKLSDNKECSGLKQCNKRKDESSIQELDNSLIKKIKETKPDCESHNRGDISLEGVKGHLMIDGVWKKVGEEDVLAIASVVRLLV